MTHVNFVSKVCDILVSLLIIFVNMVLKVKVQNLLLMAVFFYIHSQLLDTCNVKFLALTGAQFEGG